MFNFVAEPARIGKWRAAVKAARNWLFSHPDTTQTRSARVERGERPMSEPRPALKRLSLAEQWECVAGVLVHSSGQAHHARELQGRASQQIDLATYAFNSIIDELATVMALPARREPAVVHLFEPVMARAKERGAVAAFRAA